jgi:uncharacterized protein YfaQ (DUF2300 family)
LTREALSVSCRFSSVVLAGIGFWATCSSQAAQPTSAELVARVRTPEGRFESRGIDAQAKTPLGSIYKLFEYAYLVETDQPETPYVCKGQDPEERFCGSTGETLNREKALARSCSPYYSLTRLGVMASDWKAFWKKKVARPPDWLSQPERLKPESMVSVDELLEVLALIRTNFTHFEEIEAGVVGTVISGTAQDALKNWGTTLRVKTFTWRDKQTLDQSQGRVDKHGFTGGFAGWLPDGSSIWVSRAGHGREAFQSELNSLVQAHLQRRDHGCVRVRFFDRYPIERVSPELEYPKGKVTFYFKNGKTLQTVLDGSLRVIRKDHSVEVTGEMGIQEYVARVLDREVKAVPTEAARAFAVAIRTFLLQNSVENSGCLEIRDSSHLQRVSATHPSPGTMMIAKWTDGLILGGVQDLRYHSSRSSPNRMSWAQASDLAQSGYSMKEILSTAYPAGVLEYGGLRRGHCVPNPEAAGWIAHQSRRWRKRLLSEPAFEEPTDLSVCQARAVGSLSAVRADLNSGQIFVPKLRTEDDETSILHEYLHLGFRNHPKGRNEAFIENFAQILQEEK